MASEVASEEKPITFTYLRKRAGLTQREISIAMDVTVTTVSQWETGARRPRFGQPKINKDTTWQTKKNQ
ncbi:helix-turn-helix domain-containing protein [Coleofasciculus sp. G2-EDA-02]|uniref:helix-turn-helix domain-containing protein n=1 Tax=Coleofasciculus sp. G2-EDA-02 TaxID=3069529 RepID=UPI0032F68949